LSHLCLGLARSRARLTELVHMRNDAAGSAHEAGQAGFAGARASNTVAGKLEPTWRIRVPGLAE